MPNPFEIRAYAPQDEAAVVDLLQRAFGIWPKNVDGLEPTDFFRWKHLESPFGRSTMVVAEVGNEVIGFQGWLRWRVQTGAQSYEVVRGVDLAVAAEYRRQGVYKAVLTRGVQLVSEQTAFSFSTPNDQSLPWSLRVGRRKLGRVPLFVHARSPLRTATSLLGPDSAGVSDRPPDPLCAESAADALGDGAGVSDLLARVDAADGRLETIKDLAYLRWRYAPGPYRAIRAYRDDQLAGLVIFRVGRRGTLRTVTVLELLIGQGDRHAGHQLLRQMSAAAPADYATCHFPARSTARQAAVRSGFLRVPHGPIPTLRVFREPVAPDPSEPASWRLCLGDLDLL